MAKKAVIIYGPPGSGKGTQAELLAKNFNSIHFDTGRYLENLLRSPGVKNDPKLRFERQLFDSGKLNTPQWVFKIVSEATKKIAKAGWSIVYSGSPRTMFEAFGGSRQKGLLSLLIKVYGKKNIQVLELQVRDQTSIKRNSNRLICSVCGLPILAISKIKFCAFCAGAARKRTLDKPEIIKVRLVEYRNRTYPIIAKMKKLGLKISKINGEQLPYKVFKNVSHILSLHR